MSNSDESEIEIIVSVPVDSDYNLGRMRTKLQRLGVGHVEHSGSSNSGLSRNFSIWCDHPDVSWVKQKLRNFTSAREGLGYSIVYHDDEDSEEDDEEGDSDEEYGDGFDNDYDHHDDFDDYHDYHDHRDFHRGYRHNSNWNESRHWYNNRRGRFSRWRHW